MSDLKEIIGQIELHSVSGIRRCFDQGVDPNSLFRGEPLIYELTSEYGRGPTFKSCVQAFVEYGLNFEDQPLLAVLLDDSTSLKTILEEDQHIVRRTYTLRCTYTPLYKATLLHICAEFNHVNCAKVLLDHGAEVNVKAGINGMGLGGQTPIFHTVNQNGNHSIDMLHFLIANGADLHITVTGLIWGEGYEWETLIPAVNPISYAMMGLLPQMHRHELTTHEIVSILLKHAYNIDYQPTNVPNKYLSN